MGTNFVPQRTADPTEAWEWVQQDGAAILNEENLSAEGTLQAGRAFIGNKLLAMGDPFPVKAEPSPRISYAPISERLPSHTDGFGYGDKTPDYICLHCILQSAEGGDSFLIDGYSLLDQLVQDPEQKLFMEWMRTLPIDQTKTDREAYIGPILRETVSGRQQIRRHPYYQKPAAEYGDPTEQQRMIDQWSSLLQQWDEKAARFKLFPGDVLVIDNYRMLHGRDAYVNKEGSLRVLNRLWLWSTASFGAPEQSALSAV